MATEPHAQPATAPHPALGAGAALLVAVFALDVFRAVTQSLTHDEALTFHYYVARPFVAIFRDFDPNNHVLHTLLAWSSARLFGVSEWALRLPALLGGLLYLVAARRLCRRAFGNDWTALLAFALTALHPLLLDFQSAARGYGLALGFALLALERLLWVGQQPLPATAPDAVARARRVASLALGASVAANLTLVPVALALGLLGAAAIVRESRSPAPTRAGARVGAPVDTPAGATAGAGAGERAGAWLAPLARWVLPGGLLAAALLLPALSSLRLQRFTVGCASLGETADDLLHYGFAHQPDAWPLTPDGAAADLVTSALHHVLIPALLLLLALAVLRRGEAAPDPRSRATRLIGATLLVALGLLVGQHLVSGLPYPVDRTGLWLIVLVQLGAVALAATAARQRGLLRTAGRAGLAALWLLLLQYGSQVQSHEYAVWRRDASSRELYRALEREHLRAPRPQLAIACDWYDQPALNFYRHAYHAQWMPWLERTYDLDRERFDWIVFHPDDDPQVLPRLSEVLYQDPVTGTMLGALRSGN